MESASIAVGLAAFGCGGRAIDRDEPGEPAGALANGGERNLEPRDAEPAPDAPSQPLAAHPTAPDPGSSNSPGDVRFILMNRCGACHRPGVTEAAPPGPTDVLDWGSMLQQGFVEDCNADASPIIEQMRAWPVAELPPEEIQAVADRIEMGCTPEQKLCAREPDEAGCDAIRIERMLDQRCGSCHGAAARQSVGEGVPFDGLSYIDDLPLLLQNQKIVACEPENSAILSRAQNGSMPPETGGGYALNSGDQALLTRFIAGLCPGPASSAPEDAEQRRIEAALEQQCGECHGPSGTGPEGPPSSLRDVGSIDALIRGGWLSPCAPEGSPLLGRLEDGSMPPPDAAGPRPSGDDVLAIREYVARPCAGP